VRIGECWMNGTIYDASFFVSVGSCRVNIVAAVHRHHVHVFFVFRTKNENYDEKKIVAVVLVEIALKYS